MLSLLIIVNYNSHCILTTLPAIPKDTFVKKELPIDEKLNSLFSAPSLVKAFREALSATGMNDEQIHLLKTKYPEIDSLTLLYKATTNEGSANSYGRATSKKSKLLVLFQKGNVIN